jgi:hypothetical protein
MRQAQHKSLMRTGYRESPNVEVNSGHLGTRIGVVLLIPSNIRTPNESPRSCWRRGFLSQRPIRSSPSSTKLRVLGPSVTHFSSSVCSKQPQSCIRDGPISMPCAQYRCDFGRVTLSIHLNIPFLICDVHQGLSLLDPDNSELGRPMDVHQPPIVALSPQIFSGRELASVTPQKP